MKQLNLPEYSFTITEDGEKARIFDAIRKKHVALTPEEWVRQNFIRYLINDLGFSPGLIRVESLFRFNGLERRTDILAHNRKGVPVLVVECKAPEVKLDEQVFDQIVCYNMNLLVPFMVVTNGLTHYCSAYDHKAGNYTFMDYIPYYNDLQNY